MKDYVLRKLAKHYRRSPFFFGGGPGGEGKFSMTEKKGKREVEGYRIELEPSYFG